MRTLRRLLLPWVTLSAACLATPGESNESPSTSTQPLVCEGAERDPGRVTMHRLNRAEYDNTVRDLLGTNLRPARDFPNDDHGYGFDNIADVLSMSDLLADKYATAAEALVQEVVASPFEGPTRQRHEGETLEGTVGVATQTNWNLYSNGELPLGFVSGIAGRYVLRARVWGDQGGADPARAELRFNRQTIQTFDVPETSANPRVIEVTVDADAGAHTFAVAFINDFFEAPADRNLRVDWMEVEGPVDYEAPPTNQAAYGQIVTCDPATIGNAACARQSLTSFARRAWRRPITEGESDRLEALAATAYADGEPFNVGLSLGLQAILLSPNFLFRVELDPDPRSLTPHDLTAYELANRLSYFLWSSMPDAALTAKADDRSLLRTEVLQAEARRMLADPKAQALVENFAGQWLYTRQMQDVFPDPWAYPEFDDELRVAMAAETEAFFASLMNDDASLLSLLDADYTFVNDRLAAHYGLAPVGSDEMVRVDLPKDVRGSILTHGSMLTVTSRPKRTSPVIRGKWILEELLCRPPPPPPPGVEGFPEQVDGATVRERLAQHRSDPACAACHDIMDPLGLALENFDGIGKWRTHDGETEVDATGELADGRSFDGARQLAETLVEDPNTPHCFAERTFIYALGRGPEAHDTCNLDDITRSFVAAGASFEDMVVAIVSHPSFRSRRGEPETN